MGQTERRKDKRKDEDWEATEGDTRRKNLHRQKHLPEASAVEPTTEEIAAEQCKISWSGHCFHRFNMFGMLVTAWDAWKSCFWDIITHAGFFTYVHHDAGGFATYAYVREGCKIWGILRPKVTKEHSTRDKLYDLMRRITKPQGHLDYMKHTDLFTFFLMKGDVL